MEMRFERWLFRDRRCTQCNNGKQKCECTRIGQLEYKMLVSLARLHYKLEILFTLVVAIRLHYNNNNNNNLLQLLLLPLPISRLDLRHSSSACHRLAGD